MTRQDLIALAAPHGIDPDGLDDRELALVLLAQHGIDVDAPIGLRDPTRIRDADLPHLLRRLSIVVDTASPTVDDPDLLNAVESVRWLRGHRLQIAFADLAELRSAGELTPRWVDGAAFYELGELDRVAKRISLSQCPENHGSETR